MIYTLTLNPSIDYVLRIERFDDGQTIRSKSEEKYPGGKGIMVSKLLKNLGAKSINIGFLGGFTGEFIKNKLENLGIDQEFTKISDDSRINVKLKYDTETEINAQGPQIKEEEIEEFLNYLDNLNEDDFVVISGSIPKSLGDDFYRVIVNLLEMNNVRFALDTSGKKLFNLSAYRPFLVKPNKDELGEIFEDSIDSDEKIIKYARKLIDQGAENVIVSLGKDGSIFVDNNMAYKAKPIEGKLINSVGSGDSMVAGYIYGYMKGLSKIDSYKLAIACGSATAFSPDIAEKNLIYQILEKVEVEECK
ncbi:1-phosphofructokinase [Anaerococcus hydrogenalis]|uniref:Tagatose-6-phosphate kinase n=1 Tax=Anaerococcus hydrogenalis TaxID=33029 RepID=A0A2N6UJC3_9FIRM|nr:1-phosphofructokinase [Anaerococcus hydrogenalis]MBS5989548.1 1-phosphofructokinase [Anaerococcus hydrogenalis]MDK7695841.1 1-phosphofructokinase [Anaerococcus hydrogenalis]MDK7697593.1 1-phosphofructokinase [Anaerococcus hydrogenalis]MDK7708868.1 1-phosphofructokinase [Anaerococcus hydrogenalis]PMC81751.1 1-phosphofructokinase [Anaerococcus hydrogenalis]